MACVKMNLEVKASSVVFRSVRSGMCGNESGGKGVICSI